MNEMWWKFERNCEEIRKFQRLEENLKKTVEKCEKFLSVILWMKYYETFSKISMNLV